MIYLYLHLFHLSKSHCMCKSILLLVTLRAEESPWTPAVALTKKAKWHVASSCCSLQFPHLLVSSTTPRPVYPPVGGTPPSSWLRYRWKEQETGGREGKQQGVRLFEGKHRKQTKMKKYQFHTCPSIPQNGPQYHGGSWHYKSYEWLYNLYHLFEPNNIHSAAKSVRATLAGIDGDTFGSSLWALQCEQSAPENAPLHFRSHQKDCSRQS